MSILSADLLLSSRNYRNIMLLIEINKARYRKHLNIIIIGFITSLLLLSLVFGSLLISFFSTIGELTVVTTVTPAEALTELKPETNFSYNLLGVILALLVNAVFLHRAKDSDFFEEVYYVWQIKQLQNLIYRRLKKIKLAAKTGERTALIILSFYYPSQRLVYTLDDNTLTLNTVEKEIEQVEQLICDYDLVVSADEFSKHLIASYV